MDTVEPRYNNIGYSNILGSTIGFARTDLVHTNYCNIPYIRILLAMCSSLSESIVVTSSITPQMPPKRTQFTLAEKHALRAHYAANPLLSQR